MAVGPVITKSAYQAGIQCPRRLYYLYNPPDGFVPDKEASVFALTGHEVGQHAQRAHGGGRLVGDLRRATEETRSLMGDPSVPAIFEATFAHEDTLVRVDVLRRVGRDQWALIEVKSSTEPKDEHYSDVAFQRWVLGQAGVRVAATELMHIERTYVYGGGDHDYAQLFTRVDIGPEVADLQGAIPGQLAAYRCCLEAATPPDVETGPHCEKPVRCEFAGVCHGEADLDGIGALPHLHATKRAQLRALGIDRVRDIPEGFRLTEKQEIVRQCLRSGRPYIGSGLKAALTGLSYPAHFVDFETFAPAIPRYAGMRPYEHIPFQWSVHTQERPDAPLTHREYLCADGSDPRRGFAESLLDAVGHDGAVVVYNARFEKGRLTDLAGWYADLAPGLAAMRERMWDLLPVVQDHVYLREFGGSFSIKRTLPALAPGFSYEGMGVSDGADAMKAYLALAEGELGSAEASQLRRDLLVYCKQDTYAMVEIVKALRALAG